MKARIYELCSGMDRHNKKKIVRRMHPVMRSRGHTVKPYQIFQFFPFISYIFTFFTTWSNTARRIGGMGMVPPCGGRGLRNARPAYGQT
jgi:hypothetical protein